MSDALIDQIYKALRLLPEFDGNPNILTRFINLSDQLVRQYIKNEPGYELSNLSLLNGILNKITGPAARTINSNGIPQTWNGIRSALINNFADQRDETSLYNDLALLTQGPSTPQEYYEKCQNLFSTIMTYISLHETIESTIEAKRTLYKKLTLQAYLRGLRDPLGYRIRCMRPETIEKALEFVHEELNIVYMQRRNEHLPEKKIVDLPPSQALFLPSTNLPGPSRPYNSQPSRPVQIWRPQMPFNRGPSRTQQMFGAPLPNYRPQGDVFRMPQSRNDQFNNVTGPRPMSGVSPYVVKSLPFRQHHDWTKHGNPPPSNYFKSRELNFNDLYDQQYDYDDYSDHDAQYYYSDRYDCPGQTYYTTYETQFNESDRQTPVIVEESHDDAVAESKDFQARPDIKKPK